jgi:hypothetical protein
MKSQQSEQEESAVMRQRLLGSIALCLLAASIYAEKFLASNSSIRVNEAATRVHLEKGEARVAFAVENSVGRAVEAVIRLEWLDPRNAVAAEVERRETILPGASRIAIPFPLNVPSHRSGETLWYRLKYRITAERSSVEAVSGVVALSEITPDIFELHVLASEYPYPGKRYRAHVRAVHPITSAPVRGVAIAARLKFDTDTEDSFDAAAMTNAQGYAAIEFDLPRDLDAQDGTLGVLGVRGDFKHRVEEDLRNDHLGFTDLLLTTDKAIYQPGQTLHTRILAFDFARRAIANRKLNLKITDPEGTTQFRADATTSRFGVASFDWQIPENARLGDFTIRMGLDDDERGDERELRVRVSRYDLPNFAVKVKPDRSYYLPGQNAEVEIRADYLFGQPVPRGRVRVVRELGRQWNYREQKWEIQEEEKYEGEADASGRFVARIDLAKAHAALKNNSYRRFEDMGFAAYFTDATSGRTEQRRFDLRVTRDAIHVYLIGDDEQSDGLPIQFYVSTSYADGTPAPCDVAIGEQVKIASPARNEFIEAPLRTIKTNRYGVAKVAGLKLREREENDDPTIVLVARDGKGAAGRQENKLWKRGHDAIRVETDKTIYREGEPIEVRLSSNQPQLSAILSVSRDLQIVHSQTIRVRNGRAFVVLPWRKEFKDVITITAYAQLGEEEFRPSSRAVIFPINNEFRLNARMDRAEYRPGEQARASFRMLSPDGRPVESAIGVSVIDRAVEERARTDREFSGRGFYYDYIGSYFNRYDVLAGFTVRDLRKLDLSMPLPAGMELVAEILLHSDGYTPSLRIGGEFNKDLHAIFRRLIDADLDPIEAALNLHYNATGEYPADPDALRRILNAGHRNFDALRDPWERPYRAEFSTERELDVLKILCAGADEKFGTADDFTARRVGRPYFNPAGDTINRIQREYLNREEPITQDANAFKTELRQNGLDFDALRDRWGRPYQLALGVSGTRWTIEVRSSGANGSFEARDLYSSDDFTVWTASAEYFASTRLRMDAALANHLRATGGFPENEAALRALLEASGFPMARFRDFWGNELYAVFSQRFRYADRVVVRYEDLPGAAKQKTDIKPVTEQTRFITLRSRGADGKEGTPDDFTLAEFSRVAAEQASTETKPRAVTGGTSYAGAASAMDGTIVDAQGAAIANAGVTAANNFSGQSYQARSDAEGHFLLRNLPAGRYDVRCDAQGFKAMVVTDVLVQSAAMTSLYLTLEVGTVAETVTVSADVTQLQTSVANATVASSVVKGQSVLSLAKLAPGAQAVTKSDVATPRLREYFQETLVWQPAIETDKQGRAQLSFKLADNITAWKMKVVGSTVDGEIAVAEKEFLAFQPFFAEHDPPRVLTEGDEIALPVVLRNYLNKAQTVTAEIKPENWFTLTGPARKRAEVKAGDAARVIFDFRATASVKDGKQRVTAIGLPAEDANDAIEKPVNVHPDGEEILQTASAVFTDAGVLTVNVPDNAIRDTTRAELKLYPNLLAHALEGIEGILQRPYGCAEQTISSTYPNVMVLRYLNGQDERAPDMAAKARRYVQRGYERLLGYRTEGGGFTYWGRGESDVALTAYALRFLNDASRFIAVDEDTASQARAWLVKQQQTDGRWIARYWREAEDTRRTALNTAFIARVLAMDAVRNSQPDLAAAEALKRALAWLAKRGEEIDEPYLIACHALAALDGGDRQAAAKAVAKLRSLARDEAGTNYWHLESNTPFYGWGLAGRIETTALAVNALHRIEIIKTPQPNAAKDPQSAIRNPQSDDLLNRGLFFLLRNKDRYGVWLSTQATINVLDTLLSLNDAGDAMTDAGGQADVLVNGQRATSAAMPPTHKLSNPITVDLSPFLISGDNRIEIRRSGAASRATAQVVASHYVPWSNSSATLNEIIKSGASSALRFSVRYDKSAARIGETVICSVEAERIGRRVYGMLLAEIGLPPGADVDRASLERAVKESGWDLNHYDVLPDRVVVYLWPHAGGTKFSFALRLRYGIRARTSPSTLYDYYNPEARVALAPARFVVQ